MLFIFDVGGVLTNSAAIYELIAKKLNLSLDEFSFYCGIPGSPAPTHFQGKNAFTPNLEMELMKGNITAAEFWHTFTERSHVQVTENWWATLFNPKRNVKVYDIISRLKKRYRVVGGTNTIQDHYEIHQSHHDYDIFDTCYASQIIREAKPELPFWKYILAAEKTNARDAFFIDDTQENIDAADSLGINTHHFVNAEDLEIALKQYL